MRLCSDLGFGFISCMVTVECSCLSWNICITWIGIYRPTMSDSEQRNYFSTFILIPICWKSCVRFGSAESRIETNIWWRNNKQKKVDDVSYPHLILIPLSVQKATFSRCPMMYDALINGHISSTSWGQVTRSTCLVDKPRQQNTFNIFLLAKGSHSSIFRYTNLYHRTPAMSSESNISVRHHSRINGKWYNSL